METKFLRLRTPAEYGSRFGDWQVYWLARSTHARHLLLWLTAVHGREFNLGAGAQRVITCSYMSAGWEKRYQMATPAERAAGLHRWHGIMRRIDAA